MVRTRECRKMPTTPGGWSLLPDPRPIFRELLANAASANGPCDAINSDAHTQFLSCFIRHPVEHAT
jgi:hypothetical protein